MIRVRIEVTEGATSRRVKITAPSITRALDIAGEKVPGRSARVLFPIAPEDFFADQTPADPATPEPEAA